MLAVIAFSIGIAAYFILPVEPHLAYPFIIAALALFNATAWRKAKFISGLLIFVFSFCYACGWSQNFGMPRIRGVMRDTEITGVVKNIDYAADKVRIFINDFRLTLGREVSAPPIGAEIVARGTVFPPNLPDLSGGYDFSEWAYFHGISGTGFITEITGANNNAKINLREYLHNRFQSPLFDTLVLGYKNALPESDNAAWKAVGVSHVFSISGFHMTLVGGWLFAVLYFVFRSISRMTRRMPARYPAMILALAGLAFYLVLSGGDVATQRAFLMTALVFAAFILGRSLLNMRGAVMVFCALLLVNPHYVVEPGFQLSFAAIFGMLWFFGKSEYRKRTVLHKAWHWIKILIQTSLICTLFTAPFIIWHFHVFPIYSLIGNLIFLPVFSFAIMPLIMLGQTAWASAVYDWLLGLAQGISAWPHAVIQFPLLPRVCFCVMIIALLGLVAIKNKKVKIIVSCAGLGVGLVGPFVAPRPVFYSTIDNELIAYRANDGNLQFNMTKSSGHYFAFDSWKMANFQNPSSANGKLKCSSGVCAVPELNLVYTQKFMPLAENLADWCANRDFIVSYLRINYPGCTARILSGGFTIYDNGAIHYTNTNRIWHKWQK
ncbi:MAG: ComEC family competence protein [Rickettsiales bacterium]|jgi:competence protein ComEC|nr:ComEC family competence protein [Rickettsiales bacterium]